MSLQFFLGVTAKLRETSSHFPTTDFCFIERVISKYVLLSFLSSYFPFNNSLGFAFHSVVTQILLPSNLQYLLFLISFPALSGIHPKLQISLPFSTLFIKSNSNPPLSFPFYTIQINFLLPQFRQSCVRHHNYCNNQLLPLSIPSTVSWQPQYFHKKDKKYYSETRLLFVTSTWSLNVFHQTDQTDSWYLNKKSPETECERENKKPIICFSFSFFLSPLPLL